MVERISHVPRLFASERNGWFAETLDGLVKDFGVDGFKLDGADLGA